MEIDTSELSPRAPGVGERGDTGPPSRDETADAFAASRRRFLRRLTASGLVGAGAGGAALTLGSSFLPVPSLLGIAGAQETTTTTAAGSTTTTVAVVARATEADRELAAFLVGIARAAVENYAGVLTKAVLDDDRTIVAQLFMRHHEEHAGALTALAGRSSAANADFVSLGTSRIDRLSDPETALDILSQVENILAATYLDALGELESSDAGKVVASLLPVAAQHAVVLGQALGLPVDAFLPPFETVELAATPDQFSA